jgi:hypothetical protein
MVQKTAQRDLLQRLVESKDQGLTTQVAEYFLGLDFSEADHARAAELAEKAQEGRLTRQEKFEYETYIFVNDMLGILRIKAMRITGATVPPLDELAVAGQQNE